MPNSRTCKASLCLIVWNERRGCEIDVPQLPRESFREVFAVDGGSSDGTVELLRSHNIPVYRQPRASLNAAYHHAVELCTSETLVVFFPKATIDPTCLPDLAANVNGRTELVVASRNIRGACNEEDSQVLKPRKWGVTVLALIAAVLWRREGVWIRDVLHGVKAFSLDAFHRMAISEVGVTIDLEMAVRAYRLKIGRKEIPVVESSRVSGSSHFKILPTAKHLAAFLWNEVWRPPDLRSP